jgi:lipopolysaccharide export system permease protein
LFTIIAITINFSEHIEKFVDQPVTKKEIFLDYYLNFIPYINGLLWPIFSLISVIFFTSRMARNTEVVAMLNAGMSYRRFLRPYLISSLFLASIYLLGNHIFFPRGNKVMMSFENKYVFPNNYKVKSNNIHLFIGPESKVYISNYHTHDSTGTGFRLEQYHDLQLVYLLEAKSFEYLPKRRNGGFVIMISENGWITRNIIFQENKKTWIRQLHYILLTLFTIPMIRK